MNLPLSGKTVLITRARSQEGSLRKLLEAEGANVIAFPTIAIRSVSDKTFLKECVSKLASAHYDWVIFTSTNGVIHTLESLQKMGISPSVFSEVKIAAVGLATATLLIDKGLKVSLMPKKYVAEALFDALEETEPTLAGKRFLLLQADIARPILAQKLQKAGALVDSAAVYQTVPLTEEPDIEGAIEAIRNRKIDVITFTSNSTVVHFLRRLGPLLLDFPNILEKVLFASIGPVTSTTLLSRLGRVDIQASHHTIPGLVEAISDYHLGLFSDYHYRHDEEQAEEEVLV